MNGKFDQRKSRNDEKVAIISEQFFKETKRNNLNYLDKFFKGFNSIPKHIRERFDFSIVDREESGV